MKHDGVFKCGPFLPGGALADGGSAQALRILNDSGGVGIEQVAASDHGENAAGVPVQPPIGAISLHDDT